MADEEEHSLVGSQFSAKNTKSSGEAQDRYLFRQHTANEKTQYNNNKALTKQTEAQVLKPCE